MSALWAYVENLEELREGDSVVLTGDELRHVQTRRLRAADAVVLFDGRGQIAEATIGSLTKKQATLVAGVSSWLPRDESNFVLASAIPKGDRLSTMLQMLSQLGTPRWQPLLLEDSAVRKLDAGAPRLQRILLESCKVARRPWALEVAEPSTLDEVLKGVANAGAGPIFFGDREGQEGGLDPDVSLLVIGPEAGLTDRERESLLGAGAAPRCFGAHNLRIETAVVAGATAHQLARGGVGEMSTAQAVGQGGGAR